MTPEQAHLFDHILAGGKVEVFSEDPLAENIVKAVLGITLVGQTMIPFDKLTRLVPYYSPKDLEIIDLKKQLEEVTQLLIDTKKQKSKLGANLREVNGSGPTATTKSPYRAHLTSSEIKEIEAIFTHDYKTSAKTVITAYGISQPVCSRIRTGTHTKSTAKYKTHLFHIGQPKKR